MPVVNPVEAVVHRVLLLPLALPRLRLNDDNMAAKPDAAVRPPAALALQRPFRPGAQPLPPQQNAQGSIQILFVRAWHSSAPGGGRISWYCQLAGIYAMRQTAISWQYRFPAGFAG